MKSKPSFKNSSPKPSGPTLPPHTFRVHGVSLIKDYLRMSPGCILAFETVDKAAFMKIFGDRALPKVPFHSKKNEATGEGMADRSHIAWVEHKTLSEDMLGHSLDKNVNVPVVIMDHVTDPRNLGAIARSAAFFGIKHLVMASKRSSPLTDAAIQTARGAFMGVNLYEATNLSRCIEGLKERGFWIYGCDASSDSLNLLARDIKKAGSAGKIGVVLGAEGEGLSRLVKERCDHLIAILGHRDYMESLNVSVAAGIVFQTIYSAQEIKTQK